MCRTQCLLAVVALSINFAYSWDIALTFGDQLQFYGNGTKTSKGDARFRDLTALAYDAVFNILLFADKQNDNASIFSYNLTSKKFNPLVKRKSFENIQGIAFDPVTGLLFWTDSHERSIYWKSLLRSAAKDDFYGRLLLKMDDEIPRAIAVDSCRGYIYWTNINFTKPTIERARFNGSERQIVIDSGIFSPVSIAIDQRTNTLYWADDKEGIHYSIDSLDLEGKKLKNVISGIHHQPNSIAVSKDSVYWVDFGFKSVWQLPKVPQGDAEPVTLAEFNSEMPFAVAANYNIADQTEEVPECRKLAELSKNSTAIDEVISIPTVAGVYCLHGVAVAGQAGCNCTMGYKGERCEISVCQNYCFDGDCSLTLMGEPVCRCKAGYTGSRCEVDVCRNQCLNKGRCSVVEERPVCSCPEEFEGPRCEISKAKQENNTKNNSTVLPQPVSQDGNDGEFVQPTCADGWDPIRDPVLMVLGIISGLLCVACAVLITKIMKLKKRPRIKKRIIVNKNVTPLTARPDQCEITIENCCNMNICETPCFEPRSTIRPTLLDSKPGKEEKKNLIANMEYPDDY